MRRTLLLLLVAAATFLFGLASGASAGDSPEKWAKDRIDSRLEKIKGNGLSLNDEEYLRVRREYIEVFGLDKAGRNILLDGYRVGENKVRPATDEEIRQSLEVLRRGLNPPSASTPVVDSDTSVYAPAPAPVVSTPTYSAGGCGASCIQCESGGNPQAVSPAGYWGLYQFDYGTWVAHGGDPAAYGSAGASEQTAVASRVTYDAWPNC